jgi:hypothetical protein
MKIRAILHLLATLGFVVMAVIGTNTSEGFQAVSYTAGPDADVNFRTLIGLALALIVTHPWIARDAA